MENNIENITPKRNLPREVFLHLLAIVTLYWSTASFITLLFQYVNYFLPDSLLREYEYSRVYITPLRVAVSSLIIVFPVFIFISWFLNKGYIRNPLLREMKLRKWLIYFTLFVAALIIVGDLVRIVFIFLGGEITSRFILKALSILFVAGVVFGYYLNDVRKNTPAKAVKYFVWSVCVVVLAGVIGAFFIIGSPKEERLRRFDQEKISDLQNIQSNLINYWQRKEKLPEKLADLNDTISGFVIPNDPQTGAFYEYNIKDRDGLLFELCAVFNRQGKDQALLASPVSVKDPGYLQGWSHIEGRVCFERKIDKDLYPPLDKNIKN